MKVALLANSYGISRNFRGGPGIYAYSAKKALDRLGIPCDVYYELPGVDPYYLDDRCFQAVLLGKQIPKTDKTAMEKQGYTVHHCLNSAEHALLCQKTGIKPILGPNILPNSPPNHCLKYLSKDELIMRRDQIAQERAIVKVLKGAVWTYQSEFQRSEYYRLGMPRDQPVAQVSNGVDTDLFLPVPWEERGSYITWSGRKWWPKSPWLFEKIATAMPNQEFVALSDNPLGWNLPNVRFVVGMNHYQLPPYTAKAAVHLNSSSSENQALSILEPMSCGIPVVATSQSGNPEIVHHGENGMLYDINKPEEAVGHIKYLLEHPNEALEMGHRGRDMVLEKYSLAAMGKALKQVYEKYGGQTL